MITGEIKCRHRKPISECLECYPSFLRETSIGEVSPNPETHALVSFAQNILGIHLLPDQIKVIEGIKPTVTKKPGIKIVATGELAADRIMKQLDNRMTGERKPTRKQVGMVLHALADHTAIMEMPQYDRLDHWGSNAGKESEYWPGEMSIGRWFHAVGDDLEGRFQ